MSTTPWPLGYSVRIGGLLCFLTLLVALGLLIRFSKFAVFNKTDGNSVVSMSNVAELSTKIDPDGCLCDKLLEIPIGKGELLMGQKDREIFRKVMETTDNHNKTYFEWGAGGSTLVAPPWFRYSFSVENDSKWCSRMMNIRRMQCLVRCQKLKLICDEPILQLNGFGWPKKPDYDKFEHYFNAMDKEVSYNLTYFDVVLIDGRYRVACALAALKHINENSRVLIHDFWDRKHYHHVLNYYDVVEQVKGAVFVVLKKKNDTSLEKMDLEASKLMYFSDPR